MKKIVYTAFALMLFAGCYLVSCHEDADSADNENISDNSVSPAEVRVVSMPDSSYSSSGQVDDEQPVFDAGRAAAMRALSCDSATHERIEALLSIRAVEKNLRDAGLPASADAYIRGAGSVIDSIGL